MNAKNRRNMLHRMKIESLKRMRPTKSLTDVIASRQSPCSLPVYGTILVCLTLASCAIAPPPTVQQPSHDITQSDAVTHPLEEDSQITAVDDTWAWVERAKSAADRDAPALLIRAINEFLQQQQYAVARSVMATLMAYSLTSNERLSVQIIQSRLARTNAEHVQAIERLNALGYNQIPDIETKKQALKALARSQIALGYLSDAIMTLLTIDRLVTHTEQIENQQQIVQLLQTTDVLQLSLLREKPFDSVINGWLALVDLLNATDQTRITIDLGNWRRIYSNHPAQPQLIERYATLSDLDDYRQIALLLPLTSVYGAAARAFYDGFMREHNTNISSKSPQIILYDVGEAPVLSSFYYRAAVAQGADFVVGPFGRKATDVLLATQQTNVETLLIAAVPPQDVASNLFGISLSAEEEARQTADKAFADGHRQATVFRNHSEWGERVATAFVEQWQSLGGTIIKNKAFPKDISDYTRIIQKLLGLDSSIIRKRLLEAHINTRLEFTARRNDDVELLFLAANAEQARLVVPQLRFFQAHDLPIYATSYAYGGNPNPAKDEDLDGLIFGDMRWMFEEVSRYKSKIAAEQALKYALKPASESGIDDKQGDSTTPSITANVVSQSSQLDGVTTNRQQSPTAEQNPYKNSALNRLYALGIQSYQLIPRLNLLRNKTMHQFFGTAMTVRVDPNGRVVRIPVWAQFVSGLAEPIVNQSVLN